MSSVSFNNFSNYSQVQQTPKQDPDTYAQQYANQKGISLEEAKNELKTQFGDPSQGTQLPGLGQQNQQASIFSQNTSNNINADSSFDLSSISSSNSSNPLMNILNMFKPNESNQDKQSPEDVLKQYMAENNLDINNEEDVAKAKEELKAEYGDPQQMDAFA